MTDSAVHAERLEAAILAEMMKDGPVAEPREATKEEVAAARKALLTNDQHAAHAEYKGKKLGTVAAVNPGATPPPQQPPVDDKDKAKKPAANLEIVASWKDWCIGFIRQHKDAIGPNHRKHLERALGNLDQAMAGSKDIKAAPTYEA